jgi:hypothetical protein
MGYSPRAVRPTGCWCWCWDLGRDTAPQTALSLPPATSVSLVTICSQSAETCVTNMRRWSNVLAKDGALTIDSYHLGSPFIASAFAPQGPQLK